MKNDILLIFSVFQRLSYVLREKFSKWEMSPGNKIDSSIFDFTENWLFLGGQKIGLAQRQCSINVF